MQGTELNPEGSGVCSRARSKAMEGEDASDPGQGAYPRPKMCPEIPHLRVRQHSVAWKALLNGRMSGKGGDSSMGGNLKRGVKGSPLRPQFLHPDLTILTFCGVTKPNPSTAPTRHHSSSLSSPQNYNLSFFGEGTYD